MKAVGYNDHTIVMTKIKMGGSSLHVNNLNCDVKLCKLLACNANGESVAL